MDDCYWDGREILISQMHSREDGTDSCNVLVKGSQLHLWKNTKDEKIKESVNILWVRERERESRIGVVILISLERGWRKEHTGRRWLDLEGLKFKMFVTIIKLLFGCIQ